MGQYGSTKSSTSLQLEARRTWWDWKSFCFWFWLFEYKHTQWCLVGCSSNCDRLCKPSPYFPLSWILEFSCTRKGFCSKIRTNWSLQIHILNRNKFLPAQPTLYWGTLSQIQFILYQFYQSIQLQRVAASLTMERPVSFKSLSHLSSHSPGLFWETVP